MTVRHLPVVKPEPDCRRFVETLMGRRHGGPPPLVEYIVDDVVMQPIVTGLMGREWVAPSGDLQSLHAWLDNFIAFWQQMGYDFVRFEMGLPFPEKHLLTADTAPDSQKQRSWTDEHHGAIETWEDFEKYPWPRVEAFDFSMLEYVSKHLPEGMGLISSHGGGIFEHLSWIMSLEGLCLALHDDPALVRAVADRLGELIFSFNAHLLDLENLIVLFPGDDMGFRSQTLVGPSALRDYCLPWHKRFAAQAHDHGIPYFLHSCGNLQAIMEDLITDVGIDGKHSYEDAIMPADQFQARYGDRIAVLGGLDLNILSGESPEQVRQRTRFLMETCGARGRYAVGSGNSVPSYVPVVNYLAMVDEARDVQQGWK